MTGRGGAGAHSSSEAAFARSKGVARQTHAWGRGAFFSWAEGTPDADLPSKRNVVHCGCNERS